MQERFTRERQKVGDFYRGTASVMSLTEAVLGNLVEDAESQDAKPRTTRSLRARLGVDDLLAAGI